VYHQVIADYAIDLFGHAVSLTSPATPQYFINIQANGKYFHPQHDSSQEKAETSEACYSVNAQVAQAFEWVFSVQPLHYKTLHIHILYYQPSQFGSVFSSG